MICTFKNIFFTLKTIVMHTLLKKWWVLLIQGILLIILGIYVFNHPGVTLLSITFWISLMIFLAGIAGILGWLFAPKDHRETSNLLWSIASALLGFLLLDRIGFAMDLLTNLLGFWMILTGGWLMQQGWPHRGDGSSGWLMLIGGAISIIAGIIVMFNIIAGALAVSTILGIQLLLAGLALIAMSMAKKKVVGKIKDAVADIRNKIAD
jgi:uncharacterized membrane protein HdeD (DUF308 family)